VIASLDDAAVLEVDRATYRYAGRFCALQDVSLAVRPGESLALLGANGSGKSTLLKVLDGLLPLDSGTLRAFGREVTPDLLEDAAFGPAFRRRVGFVFQDADVQVFSPTVFEEVAFGPLQLGIAGADLDERVHSALGLLGAEALVDRTPYELSGGEKKRVALASVLVLAPEVLLLDEPLEGLDPRARRMLLRLLEDLRRAGRTVVFASHDLAGVTDLATRAAVFGEDHRILAEGEPKDLVSDCALLARANLE